MFRLILKEKYDLTCLYSLFISVSDYLRTILFYIIGVWRGIRSTQDVRGGKVPETKRIVTDRLDEFPFG